MARDDIQNKKVAKGSIQESSEFIKHKNNLKKALINAMGYGDEIRLVNNSRGIELFDYLIGSIGVIVQKTSKREGNDTEVRYIALFGDLKLDVLSSEIEPYREEW